MRLQLIGRLSRWQKLRHVLGVWLVVSLTVGAPWVDAAVYYVNATTGDNLDPGTSSALAWETITYALTQVTSGDTVNVEAGLYDTPTNLETFPLELKSGVALIGAGAGSVTALNLTGGGSGYDSAPAVTFTGGGGTGAEAFAVISGGVVTELVLTGGGGGYTSAPTVVFTGGTPDVAATATATIGPGVSTISAPEGTDVFYNDEALSSTTRLSGFLLKHDASTLNDEILEFEVGAFTMSPRIDNNAFVDYNSAGNGDTGIFYYDNSTGDGIFTPTIENNTMSGLYVGTWMSSAGTAVGGTGDNFSPTIQNNSFTSVDYPIDFSVSISQGGDVRPQVLNNTTWNADYDIYIDMSLGSEFDTYAPVISSNTFREATATSVSSEQNLYSGTHTVSPTYANNTITSPVGDGILISLSVSNNAQDQMITPTIVGNTITDANLGDGIAIFFTGISPAAGATVTFSPTINSNTITDVSSTGISVTLSSAWEGNLVSNMTVSSNRIENAGSQGIHISLSSFFSTSVDGLNINWTIANNTILDSGDVGLAVSVSSLAGIDLTDVGVMNTTITGNTIDGSSSTNLYLSFSPNPASVVDSTWTIEGNTMTDSQGSYGLFLDFSSGANADQTVTVRGNTITGNNSQGIYVELSTQTAIDTNNLSISDNFIDSNGGYGIYVDAIDSSPDQMIFSCNTITNNDDGGVYISAFSVSTLDGASGVNFGDSTTASPGNNNINSNSGGTFDFFNDSALPIKAENNYWGSTDSGTIDSQISDDNELTGGEVDFTPFLASAAEITRAVAADVVFSGLQDDADSSGGPTIGDTLRFCTTVTGAGNCGTGQAVTLTIPVPSNVTLVSGSITTDHGAVDLNSTDVVVNGIVLEPGEVANICFDIVVNSGDSVVLVATVDGPDVPPAVDTLTFPFGAPATPGALPAEIPTVEEWGLILMSCLLMLIGLFTIRRGGLAAILAAAFLLVTAPGAYAAKAGKIKHQAVTIQAVSVNEGKVTIDLADGTSYTVAGNDLEIKDQRVSRADKRAARLATKNEKRASRSAVQSSAVSESRASRSGTRKDREGKLSVDDLAALLSSPAAKSNSGQAAILKVKDHGRNKEAKVKLTLYPSVSQAQSAVTERDAAKSAAQARKEGSKKSN